MKIVSRRNLAGILVMMSAALIGACTKDEAAEPVAPEPGSESGAESSGDDGSAAEIETTQENAADDTTTEDSPSGEPAATQEEDTSATEDPAGASTGLESPAPQEITTPSPPSDASATVWYVKSPSAPVYDAPGGKEVRRMRKGDHILVTTDGEWAKVHDGTWMREKDLSSKPVARPKPKAAVWK